MDIGSPQANHAEDGGNAARIDSAELAAQSRREFPTNAVIFNGFLLKYRLVSRACVFTTVVRH